MIRFAEPTFFLLFLLLIPVVILSQKASGTIRYSNINILKSVSKGRKIHPRMILTLLRVITLSLFILALARPQAGKVLSEVSSEGVDILLALDTSGSMQALDFKIKGEPVNRLTIVKNVVTDFIKKRSSDRMGLVVFAEEAFIQCPLTLDHGILLDFLKQVEIGMAGDGTAIGSAIGLASIG